MVTIAAAIAAIAVAVHAFITRRVGSRLVEVVDELAASFQAGPNNGPGTDPATVERLESLERRFEALAADAQKWYRKAAQERRRIEGARSDDDDDDTPGGVEQLRLPQPASARAPNGRPRLRRPLRR